MQLFLRTSNVLRNSFKYDFRLCRTVRSIHNGQFPINNDKIYLNDTYKQFKFNELIYLTHQMKYLILDARNKQDLNGENIAILCSNNYLYFVSLLAVWLANGVPVPLNKNYSLNYLEYFIKDSKSTLIINGSDSLETARGSSNDHLLKKQNVPMLNLKDAEFYTNMNHQEQINTSYCANGFFKEINMSKSNHENGLILYTSGSSGPPKGVILTYSNLVSQIESLIDCWKLGSSDCVLNVLPLNHVHGLIYSLLAPFIVGAQVHLLPKFDAETTWHKLIDQNNSINIITAVPTVYVKLLDFYNQNTKFKSDYNKIKLSGILSEKIRIMASASAPLNTQTFNNWLNVTGYQLVERYGLSETGMCLSNSVEKSKKCISGTVGRPYADIHVRISALDENLNPCQSNPILVESNAYEDEIFANRDQTIVGELQIKGPIVFKEYLNQSERTCEAFTKDGWFKTGDIAEFLRENKIYKIIGRCSVDLIKSGGFKINARDIEKEILAHPCVDEVAVMGLDDIEWGQSVFALVALKPDWKLRFMNEDKFTLEDLKKWLRPRLPKHCMPKSFKKIDQIPRNNMGKINKRDLIKIYQK